MTDPMPFTHTPTPDRRHLRIRHTHNHRYTAYCDCGWTGPTRRLRATTVIDHTTHTCQPSKESR